MDSVEKALATLPNHPFFVAHGILLSPYPSSDLLPLPDPYTPARAVRPTRHVEPRPEADGENPTTIFVAHCPTPGELFEDIRPWGSLRSVRVWADGFEGDAAVSWGARVEFWYEDEARRFEVGFGQTGSLVKGWQM
jgi:hypothetical protein